MDFQALNPPAAQQRLCGLSPLHHPVLYSHMDCREQIPVQKTPAAERPRSALLARRHQSLAAQRGARAAFLQAAQSAPTAALARPWGMVCSAKQGKALCEMGSPLLTAAAEAPHAAWERGRGRAPYLRMFMGATLSHVLVLGL